MFALTAANAAVDLENISLLNASIVAVTGYAVVFAGLILLMLVVILIGKAFISANNKKKETVVEPVPTAEPAPVVDADANVTLAPGTAGQLKLYDTPPKTAAMLMAIVADKMGKPLNELRFISIKEVK